MFVSTKVIRLFIILVLLKLPVVSSGHPYTRLDTTIQSTFIDDSFKIAISLPGNYLSGINEDYKLLLYTDEGLALGNEIKMQKKDSSSVIFKQYITVGIGFSGQSRVKRRQYFIPDGKGQNIKPVRKNSQIDSFARFVNEELLPWIISHYRIKKDSLTYVGHSLGGVFGLYMMTLEESRINRYVIISPSIWVNNKAVLDYFPMGSQNHTVKGNTLEIKTGGLEIVNRILLNSIRFNKFLDKQGYHAFVHSHEIYWLSGHLGAVRKSMHSLQ